jgi:nucleoside-diphosphate-sugar epimerase
LYEKNRAIDLPCEFIRGDVRNIKSLWPLVQKADALVNLAALSNDPTSDLDPKLTWDINYKANETIAKLCQASNKRVVFASSCSVYGFSPEAVFTEDSKPGPVTLYGKTKMLSEEFYLAPGVDSVILRFATVYGYSDKPRFDLVVNTMIGSSFFNKKIVVNGGAQWRPLVHVKDVAHSIYLALRAKDLKNRVFNVGSNDQNYKIIDLAYHIKNELPEIELQVDDSNIDKRSYKVDFSRIENELGFKTQFGIKDAIKELYESFNAGMVSSMADDVYYRVKYLKRNYFYFPNWQPKWAPLKQLRLKLHKLRI